MNTKKLRHTKENKEWRLQVLERDLYTCQECGSTERLEVHHKMAVCKYPELVNVLSNGITLCHDCHTKTDSYLFCPIEKREKVKKQNQNKKSITLNDCTMQLLVELASKMGMTENAVVSVALHKLAKEV